MYFEHRVTLIYGSTEGLNRHMASLIEKKGFTSGGPGDETKDGEKTYNLYKEISIEEFNDDFFKNYDSGITWTGEPHNSPPLLQYHEEVRRAW